MKLVKNCECCHASYSTGKDYEDGWCELPNHKVETKGLCEMCNVNSKFFCCPNHGKEYSIGNKTYQPLPTK